MSTAARNRGVWRAESAARGLSASQRNEMNGVILGWNGNLGIMVIAFRVAESAVSV